MNSEHAQSMPYVCLQMPIGWNGLGMTIIVYMHRPLGRAHFKTRGG